MILIAVAVVLSAGVLGVPVALPPPATTTTTFHFLDRGLWRTATRGPVPGTDDAPVDVVYADPATGRSTRARIGSTVIVKAKGAIDSVDVVVVRSLFPSIGLWLVKSARPGEDGLALAQRLADDVDDGRLLEAFPDLQLGHRLAQDSISIPPDDPRYVGQFFFEDLEMEGAWALSLGDPSIVVAVVDNGCDLVHPDLQAKLDPGHDVVDEDDDPSFFPGADASEHGTACAGLIAAVTDNGVDVAGACPLCRATCTRLLSPDGSGVPLNADVRAFGVAFEDDVEVVSNSWGFIDDIPVPAVLAEAITEVATNGRGGKGAIVVFAAGNDTRLISDDELLAVDGVVGVGAVNNLGELTQFSNRGPSVDVVAPTGSVTTDLSGPAGANAGDVTVSFGGTSSACPIVAGIVGLILALEPELSAAEVNEILVETAKQSVFASPDDAGHDDEYGFGLVQPVAALERVVDPPPDIKGGAGCDCAHGFDQRDGSAITLSALVILLCRRRRRR
ncbi:MAG: S8 family serine peptidase [Deltaproteobacteria bacterium]|nr:S8 family serine peptidase [Deltaproteobacteria bacterium]